MRDAVCCDARCSQERPSLPHPPRSTSAGPLWSTALARPWPWPRRRDDATVLARARPRSCQRPRRTLGRTFSWQRGGFAHLPRRREHGVVPARSTRPILPLHAHFPHTPLAVLPEQHVGASLGLVLFAPDAAGQCTPMARGEHLHATQGRQAPHGGVMERRHLALATPCRDPRHGEPRVQMVELLQLHGHEVQARQLALELRTGVQHAHPVAAQVLLRRKGEWLWKCDRWRERGEPPQRGQRSCDGQRRRHAALGVGMYACKHGTHTAATRPLACP